MSLLANYPFLGALFQGLLAVGLVAAGAICLRSAHVDRTPKLAARREARRTPYVSPHATPLPLQTTAPRLESGSELQRLSGMLDAAGTRVRFVHDATATASRQIAGAETALDRLIADVATVMPETARSTATRDATRPPAKRRLGAAA